MRKALTILAFSTLSVFAQPSAISINASAQQAIVNYTAPSSAACTVAVTSGGVLADTVYDVSNSEFAGANSDLSRTGTMLPLTGTTTWGGALNRQLIIGHRAVAKGASGLRRSLSLQAATAYSLALTCPGGTVTVPFTTANPVEGNQAPESSNQLFDSTAFGNLGWPDMDWTAGSTNGLFSSQVIVDPLTGIAYTPFTWFNANQFCSDAATVNSQATCTQGSGTNLFDAFYNSSGTWTNPGNITSGNSGSLATTTDTTPMFVAIGPSLTGDSTTCPNFTGGCVITDLRVTFTGNMSGGTKTVHFCLTKDSGQTCLGSSQSITLTGSTTSVCYPACGTALVAPFTEWGLTATAFPYADQVWPWTTSVNTAVSTVSQVTSWPSSSGKGFFPVDYPAGAKVIIATSSCTNHLCTNSSVSNANTMTLVENVGTLTGVAATAANFGIKITNDAAGGTLNLTVSYGVVYEQIPGWAIQDGASDQVSLLQTPVTRDRDGSTISSTPVNLAHLEFAYNINNSAAVLYAFNPVNAHVWPVGKLYQACCTFSNQGSAVPALVPWDPSTPGVWYSEVFDGTSDGPEWGKISYLGNGTPYTIGAVLKSGVYGTVLNGQSASGTGACTGGATWGNVCNVALTSSVSNDLRTALGRLLLFSKGGISGNPGTMVGASSSGYLVAEWPTNNIAGQDGPSGFTFTKISTGTNTCVADTMLGVDCGSGQVAGTVYGGALHTSGGWISGGRFVHNLINPLGLKANGNWVGPPQSLVTFVCTVAGTGSGTASCNTWSAATSLTSGFSLTCPAAECGSPTANAIGVRISGEMCNPSPAPNELSQWTCPWSGSESMIRAIAIGGTVGDKASLQGEMFNVLSKETNSNTDIVMWLARASNGSVAASHANGWTMSLQPTGSNGGGDFIMDMNASPMVWYSGQQVNAHQDFGPAPSSGYNYAGGSKVLYGLPVSVAGIQTVPVTSPLLEFWGGVWMQNLGYDAFNARKALPGNGQIETYADCRNWNAGDTEKVQCADYRAYQCGSFTASGNGCATEGITLTQIVAGGRTHIYQYAGLYTMLPKLFPADAFAGAYAMQDVSTATLNSFTDASPTWSFCIAYKANECVTGSSVGNVYYNGQFTLNNLSNWYSNNIEGTSPFINNASPVAPWALQYDIQNTQLNGNYVRFYRRIGQGLGGQTRNYPTTNWRLTPDGGWGLLQTQFVGGQFPMILLAKLPPWRGLDSGRRDYYQFQKIQLGSGAALAQIRFGYEEYGAFNAFNCMPRQEACSSVNTPVANNPATPSNGTPFDWILADSANLATDGTSCASGCTITIPAIPGRIVWWQTWRSSNGGSSWAPEGPPPQPLLVQ